MSMMQEKMYMDVDDVCAILGVSKIGIYRLVPFLSKFFFNAISVGRIDPIKGIS